MHASLPDLKYRSQVPPSSMFHHHRVPLFVIQSFLYSFNVLAHSCASLPLRCKCSAYRGLSVTITTLVASQAWPCFQVWCCSIHREGVWTNRSSPRFSQELYFDWLCLFCQHPSRGFLVFNLILDCQSIMDLHPVNTILFKYMLSSVFLETIQSSRHASHSLQYKGSWLYAQCSSQYILLNSFNQFVKRNVLTSSMMLLLSPILMRWNAHLASKQIVP
jgi:hypothetical protein